MSKIRTIVVENTEIRLFNHEKEDFVSLTDIASRFGETRIIIQNWMRARGTLDFLSTWEQLHNPGFKGIEFDAFKNESGTNAFTMSPEKWIEGVNAIGIYSKRGRYNSGTFAHRDIALGFCYWINPAFQLYLIKRPVAR
jgi:KilA-N domain